MKYRQLSPSELEAYNVGYMVGSHQIVITDTEWESDQEHKIYRKGYNAGIQDWKRKNQKSALSAKSANEDMSAISAKSTMSTLSNPKQCQHPRGDYRGVDMDMVMEEKRDKGVIGGKEKGGKGVRDKLTVDWGEVQNRWERIATKYKLSKISVLTDKRKQQFKARLVEHQIDTKQFFDIVNKALWTSQFLQGYKMELVDGEVVKIENDNKWKASFDFFLQSSSFAKARENKYASPELLIEFEELERQQGGTNAD